MSTDLALGPLQTRSLVALALATAGAGGTVAACFLPWAWFAGDVSLFEFSGWGWYLGPALVLNVATVAALLSGPRSPRALRVGCLVVCAATLAAAAMTMSRYSDVTAYWDGRIIPAIMPGPGIGGLVAIASTVCSGLAVITLSRR